MDTIKCIADGKDYTIWQFNKLIPAQLEKLRRHLICDTCGANAYYRKKSSDGKPACFGARPHIAGCTVATTTLTFDEQLDIEDVNKIITADDAIQINFELTLSAAKAENQDKDQYSGHHADPSQHHVNNPAKHRIATRGLKTLLNYLMRAPSFARSNTMIYTSPQFKRRAKDLFVKFEDAEPDDKPYLFWGMISDIDSELDWLNTGGRESVSIPISDMKEILTETLDTNEPEDFAGANAIIFGWCKKSNNDKLYIQVKDKQLCHIFVKMNSDKVL